MAAPLSAEPTVRTTFPVIEIFGPTIQGEGPDAGAPCSFVRFGLCDFRCAWCDSMYAVEPSEVRANAEKLSAWEIRERLVSLAGDPKLVVLSGGNPAIHELGDLVRDLKEKDGRVVTVETQGSIWRPWLARVDRLIVSPKPPSSGMATEKHLQQLRSFLISARKVIAEDQWEGWMAIKVPIFDDDDLDFAKQLPATFDLGGAPLYLSAGTPVEGGEYPLGEIGTQDAILSRYAWLARTAAADPALRNWNVLPQLHVLAFGIGRGV